MSLEGSLLRVQQIIKRSLRFLMGSDFVPMMFPSFPVSSQELPTACESVPW